MQAYFSGRKCSILEVICIAGLVACIPVAVFMPGGIPIGGTVAAVLAVIMIFCHTVKVKDSEVDAALQGLLDDRQISPDPRTTVQTFDLSVAPVIKGKDGRLRTSRYVVSQFVEDADGLHITVYRVDLLEGKTARTTHDLPLEHGLTLSETPISTPVGRRIYRTLSSPWLGESIPVTTDDMDSVALLQTLGVC